MDLIGLLWFICAVLGVELNLVCLRMEESKTSLGVLVTPYRELDLNYITFW